jgi:hypothetical protein
LGVRRLPPMAFAAVIIWSGQVLAQSPFPAPLPGQGRTDDSVSVPEKIVPGVPSGSPSPFPGAGTSPVFGGGGDGTSRAKGSVDAAAPCGGEFATLREEAERRGRLIKAASERHAPPDEACKLISDFERAEIRMINYVDAHMASCAIPPGIPDQLKSGHRGTEALLKKVCRAAEQKKPGSVGNFDRVWPPKGPTGDF